MPYREFRCSKGHDWGVLSSMREPPPTKCPFLHDVDKACDGEVRSIISKPQRPIVKSGTPIHHGRAGVE